MPDYVVYSTSNTHYQRWQCELLNESYRQCGQTGELVCLCSEGEHGDLEPMTSDIANLVQLPNYMRNAETGDFWGIANKIESLKEWLSNDAVTGSILFVDPDMIFVDAVNIETNPGTVVAQRWVDINPEHDMFVKYGEKVREQLTHQNLFMYPYVMHADDARLIMDRYYELAYQIRHEDKKWESDMYALIIASLEHGLKIETIDNLGVCNNWEKLNDQPASIVHFPSPFLDVDGKKIFFKQDYTPNTHSKPWTGSPNPDQAVTWVEKQVLKQLESLIGKQRLHSPLNDYRYWERLQADDCLPGYTADPDKFVVFDQYPGGFNNIRMSLELAAVIAFVTDRTLVLPPRTDFYLLEGECGFEDFFDMTDLGIATIEFDDYCKRVGITESNDQKETFERISEQSETIDADLVANLLVLGDSNATEETLTEYKAGRPGRIHLSDSQLEAQSLFFPQNLLGSFYLTIFLGDRLADVCRYVAAHIHYHGGIFDTAWRMIQHLGDGNYAAVHIRRNDFQYKDLFIDGAALDRHIAPLLKDGETLYIATDADDKSFLQPLMARYRVVFYRDVEHLIPKDINPNHIPIFEQLICTRARVFIGNRLSTLSSYVYRMRGYMQDVFENHYHENTSDGTLPINRNDHDTTFSWTADWIASWAREYPEVWSFHKNDVFVSVAAYRDPDVANTVRNLFDRARHPERVFVGVCLQDTDEVISSFEFNDHPNVRVLPIPFEDSLGASFARSEIQTKLYQGERYYLQVDSHSRFAPDWDVYLPKALDSCKAAKPILSTYPNPFDRNDTTDAYLNEDRSNGISYQRFDDEGYLHVRGSFVVKHDVPIPGMWIGAGFIFAHGAWLSEVPYDPDIYFKGEEDSLTLRSYTHGWDIFIPPHNVVFHDYNDNRMESETKMRPLHWEDHPGRPHGFETVLKLQRGVGIGSVRTIKDFEHQFGVNFQTRELTEFAKAGHRANYDDPTLTDPILTVHMNLKQIAKPEHLLWIFCLYNEKGEEILRRDFDNPDIISGNQTTIEIFVERSLLEENIVRALVWPAFGRGNFDERNEFDVTYDKASATVRMLQEQIVEVTTPNPDEQYAYIVISFLNEQRHEIHREIFTEPFRGHTTFSFHLPEPASDAVMTKQMAVLPEGVMDPPVYRSLISDGSI